MLADVRVRNDGSAAKLSRAQRPLAGSGSVSTRSPSNPMRRRASGRRRAAVAIRWHRSSRYAPSAQGSMTVVVGYHSSDAARRAMAQAARRAGKGGKVPILHAYDPPPNGSASGYERILKRASPARRGAARGRHAQSRAHTGGHSLLGGNPAKAILAAAEAHDVGGDRPGLSWPRPCGRGTRERRAASAALNGSAGVRRTVAAGPTRRLWPAPAPGIA